MCQVITSSNTRINFLVFFMICFLIIPSTAQSSMKHEKRQSYKNKKHKVLNSKRKRNGKLAKNMNLQLGGSMTSLFSPTFGLLLNLKLSDHHAVSSGYGGGLLDTSNFVEDIASKIQHTIFKFSYSFYPSKNGSFFIGLGFSTSQFKIDSNADAELIDHELEETKKFTIPQTTIIESTHITPTIGFNNKLFKSIFGDIRFGISLPFGTKNNFTAKRDSASQLDDQQFKESTEKEYEQILKIFGNAIPYISFAFGYDIDL